jgi:phosphohistidine phosphatase
VRRLLLLRHAKTVPGGPRTDDHARKLAPRGEADAPAMGRYMRAHALVPDLILSSDSRRTVETVELVTEALKTRIETEYITALYLAEPETIIDTIRAATDKARIVCVVGHNPGMEQTASLLARDPVRRKERDYFEAIEEKFPTGALAVLDFDVARWREIAPGEGALVDFVRPRDL